MSIIITKKEYKAIEKLVKSNPYRNKGLHYAPFMEVCADEKNITFNGTMRDKATTLEYVASFSRISNDGSLYTCRSYDLNDLLDDYVEPDVLLYEEGDYLRIKSDNPNLRLEQTVDFPFGFRNFDKKNIYAIDEMPKNILEQLVKNASPDKPDIGARRFFQIGVQIDKDPDELKYMTCYEAHTMFCVAKKRGEYVTKNIGLENKDDRKTYRGILPTLFGKVVLQLMNIYKSESVKLTLAENIVSARTNDFEITVDVSNYAKDFDYTLIVDKWAECQNTIENSDKIEYAAMALTDTDMLSMTNSKHNKEGNVFFFDRVKGHICLETKDSLNEQQSDTPFVISKFIGNSELSNKPKQAAYSTMNNAGTMFEIGDYVGLALSTAVASRTFETIVKFGGDKAVYASICRRPVIAVMETPSYNALYLAMPTIHKK